MALIKWDDFENEMGRARVVVWTKQLYKQCGQKLFFEQFLPPREPIAWHTVFKNRINSKIADIKAGLLIVFKGEYPDEDY